MLNATTRRAIMTERPIPNTYTGIRLSAIGIREKPVISRKNGQLVMRKNNPLLLGESSLMCSRCLCDCGKFEEGFRGEPESSQ